MPTWHAFFLLHFCPITSTVCKKKKDTLLNSMVLRKEGIKQNHLVFARSYNEVNTTSD